MVWFVERLIESLCRLTNAIEGYAQERRNDREELKAIRGVESRLHHVEQKLDTLMSKLSDYLASQTAFNTRQTAAVDSLVASVDGLTGDVKNLNDQIAVLQNSPGGVTPEDAATIDKLQTQGGDLAIRLDGVATALAALDAATPPVPPPAPGPTP